MRLGLDARLAGPGLGVSTLMRALARELPGAGVEVVWIGDPALAPDAAAEVVGPPPPGFPGFDSPRGRRLASELRLDLVHFTANSGWWSAGPSPHVVTVHDLIWSHAALRRGSVRQVAGHAYLRFAVPRTMRAAGAIAVPSAVTARAVRDRYGCPCEVIHNGIADEWRRGSAVASASPYVVAFAGRDPRKGTALSIAAWTRVARRGVGLRLLAGAGLPRSVLRSLPELHRQGDVEVLPYLPLDELVEVVRGGLALLYPSREEGFGLPVAEAMAAGVPVLAGLSPATSEVGGDAMLSLDVADPAASAARHLERLLDDDDFRESIVALGRARAAAFSWTDAVARYRDLYTRVTGR